MIIDKCFEVIERKCDWGMKHRTMPGRGQKFSGSTSPLWNNPAK